VLDFSIRVYEKVSFYKLPRGYLIIFLFLVEIGSILLTTGTFILLKGLETVIFSTIKG
jgi:hypothetical protein